MKFSMNYWLKNENVSSSTHVSQIRYLKLMDLIMSDKFNSDNRFALTDHDLVRPISSLDLINLTDPTIIKSNS